METKRESMKKRVPRLQFTENDAKVTRSKYRLSHEEKKPPSRLMHTICDAPGNAVLSQFHKALRECDDDNISASAVDGTTFAAEATGHSAVSVHRAGQQKKAIKQEYAKAKRSTAKASEIATKAAAKAAEKTKQAAEFARKHRKEILIILCVAALLLIFMSLVSSCSVMIQSALGRLGMTTYLSSEETLLAVEKVYCEQEHNLQVTLTDYEALHPGCDEYRITGAILGHDPYVLASILSAMYGEFSLEEAKLTLDAIFAMQYQLNEIITTETRYRTELRTDYYRVFNPNTGEIHFVPYTYEVQVPYPYTICTVTLNNTSMEDLVDTLLTDEQKLQYEIYMETKGNYPELFGRSAEVVEFSATPIEPYEPDTFSLMKAEAERYLGYPFVWGGSSPATSFDCSGYVSWVANHSGWDIGRLSAQGLYSICTQISADDAKPGDLIFFKGTYPTYGISHVGIYAGNDEMLHAGNPISYADLTLPYWRKHLYIYGRLPEQEVT